MIGTLVVRFATRANVQMRYKILKVITKINTNFCHPWWAKFPSDLKIQEIKEKKNILFCLDSHHSNQQHSRKQEK